MAEIHAHLTTCFLAVFPELTPTDAMKATPSTVKGWDSVATLTLLTVIEEKFGVEIEFADVMESLSYEQIAGYVQKRIEARSGRAQG